MIALDNNSILVGQIKQILHTFNLPLCQIGRDNPQPNSHFIIDTDIFMWDENLKEIWVSKYLYGASYLNITANLKIQNIIYDRYTHRYLGKYLRFLRDYNGIDLMSMYNCADGEILESKISIESIGAEFEPNDPNYITYQIPVSFGVDLTLSLNSLQPFDVCLFPKVTNQSIGSDNKFRDFIAAATYRRIHSNNVTYYNPTQLALDAASALGDDISKEDVEKFLKKSWNDLFILIKVPRSINTSLVVLEGKYYKKNNKELSYFRYQPCYNIAENGDKPIDSKKVKSYINAIGKYDEDQLVTLDTDTLGPYYYSYLEESGYHVSSQLLSYENNSSKYLLADRLVEYLTANATYPLSSSAEIKRVQKALDDGRDEYALSQLFYVRQPNSDPVAFYVRESAASLNPIPFVVTSAISINHYTPRDRHYGIWNYLDLQDLRSIIEYSKLQLDYDVLGYLDKGIEDVLKGDLDNADV